MAISRGQKHFLGMIIISLQGFLSIPLLARRGLGEVDK
jgi:hypothetical protein